MVRTKAKGLAWLGTRTSEFEDTVRFFRDVLGLRTEHKEPDFAVFGLPNGDRVEVFGPGDRDHTHFEGPDGNVYELTGDHAQT